MQRTIKRIRRLIKNLYSKFFNRREANYVKTYNYFTFDDYIKYGCSYYTLPTNFEKCKNFDGKLVDIKEGCKLFDEVILKILKDKKIKEYIKYS